MRNSQLNSAKGKAVGPYITGYLREKKNIQQKVPEEQCVASEVMELLWMGAAGSVLPRREATGLMKSKAVRCGPQVHRRNCLLRSSCSLSPAFWTRMSFFAFGPLEISCKDSFKPMEVPLFTQLEPTSCCTTRLCKYPDTWVASEAVPFSVPPAPDFLVWVLIFDHWVEDTHRIKISRQLNA